MSDNVPEFEDELREYLIAQFPSLFTETTLKLGRLELGVDGVFIQTVPSEDPDPYVLLRYPTIDFWALDSDGDRGREKLRTIYNHFHAKYHTTFPHFLIYSSKSGGEINDMDTNIETRLMYRLTMMFKVVSTVS